MNICHYDFYQRKYICLLYSKIDWKIDSLIRTEYHQSICILSYNSLIFSSNTNSYSYFYFHAITCISSTTPVSFWSQELLASTLDSMSLFYASADAWQSPPSVPVAIHSSSHSSHLLLSTPSPSSPPNSPTVHSHSPPLLHDQK
jgi:hypothetical protein